MLEEDEEDYENDIEYVMDDLFETEQGSLMDLQE